MLTNIQTFHVAIDKRERHNFSEWVNGFNIIYRRFIAVYKYRYAVIGPDSSRGFICQHTEVPCRR